ncbi:hypothetical protein D3C81_1115520 [compost metagenome]
MVRLPSSEMNSRPMRLPSPVFLRPREIRIATTISQISGLAKLLSASVMAPLDEVDVTCDSETMTMAIMAITPIGMTFKIIARMVVRKIATRPQAFGVKPSGAGKSSMPTSMTVQMMAGTSRKGTASLKCRNMSRTVLYIVVTFHCGPGIVASGMVRAESWAGARSTRAFKDDRCPTILFGNIIHARLARPRSVAPPCANYLQNC